MVAALTRNVVKAMPTAPHSETITIKSMAALALLRQPLEKLDPAFERAEFAGRQLG
jgi:hypothetical protein